MQGVHIYNTENFEVLSSKFVKPIKIFDLIIDFHWIQTFEW